MIGQKAKINLVAVAVVSSVLILYAVTQLVQAFVLDRSYPLYAEIPQASGLRENKEVTYNGHPIGRVTDVEVMPRGARVKMAIDNGVQVPKRLDAVVLRRSPIGEQAIDLRPLDHIEGDERLEKGQYYEPGSTLEIRELTLPPDVQELFETAVDVLEPVDPDNTGKLVAELADTVRGRRDDIRSIMRDSADFSEAVADNGDSYDRLWRESRVVNAELAEHRGTIATVVTDLRNATTILTDMRGEFERLLVEAPPTLTTLGEFIDEAQPNLSCTIDTFANFNEMTARPENLHNASEALRNNRYFFVGFEAQTALDHKGRNWFRVFMEPPHGPPPSSYLPDKRAIRPILPGGACESPFGPGAPAATQANFAPRIPEARVVRPANDRRTSPEPAGTIGGSASASRDLSGSPDMTLASARTAAANPAGADAAALAVGALVLGLFGEGLRRRTRRD